MVYHIRNTWKQIREKGRWGYIPLATLIGISYLPVKGLFTTQEPTIWVTESTLTVNVLVLFMAWGASCPIIAKKLGKPAWVGYMLLLPVLMALVFFMSFFGMQTRW